MKSWSWALAVVSVVALSVVLSAGRASGDELAANGARIYYDVQGSGPPGLTGYDWPEDPSFAAMSAAARAGDGAGAMALWLKHPYMEPAMEQPAVAAKIRVLSARNEKSWTSPPVKQQYPDPPAITRLPQITAPTLLILGERDVPDIHKIVGILAKQIPGARLVTVPRAGHMVNMEAPADFRRAVVDFLKQAR